MKVKVFYMLPEPLFWKVHMYGIMVAVGILAAFLTLFYCCKKKGIDPKFVDFLFYNSIVSVILGFGSAALFQATYDYIENPEAGFNIGGGITFIGGFIGGAAVFLILYAIFRKKYSSRLLDVLSILPVCIVFGHAFGRVGCFFAGCCYGKVTDCFLGVKFPNLPEKVHPTQLYEAAFLFILAAVMFVLVMKWGFRHNLSVYLIGYGVFRFLIEFLRDDDRGSLVAGMTPSQFWSVIMVLIGIGLIFLMIFVFPVKKTVGAADGDVAAVPESNESNESNENTEA